MKSIDLVESQHPQEVRSGHPKDSGAIVHRPDSHSRQQIGRRQVLTECSLLFRRHTSSAKFQMSLNAVDLRDAARFLQVPLLPPFGLRLSVGNPLLGLNVAPVV